MKARELSNVSDVVLISGGRLFHANWLKSFVDRSQLFLSVPPVAQLGHRDQGDLVVPWTRTAGMVVDYWTILSVLRAKIKPPVCRYPG